MSVSIPIGSPPATSSTPPSTTSAPPTTSSTPATSSTPQTTSTTTSSTTSTTTASTTASSTTTSSSLLVTSGTNSVGGYTEYTSVVVATPSTSVQPNNDTSKSSSFFSNTGAVAGTFTVVGLVVVALGIALITNAVRRRRAKRFDRDVAEAAAEAAASSRSPFDDYAYSGSGSNGGGGGGGGGGGYAGYSDNSHGTFAQQPMSLAHPNDSYGMSEMSRFDPYSAGAASLAAAGIPRGRTESEGTPGLAGVGAGTLAREPSRRSPYHAFAGPASPPPQMQMQMQMQDNGSGSLRYRRGPGGTNQDILEAAGLGGTGAAAMAANGPYVNRRPSEHSQPSYQNSARRRSQGYGDAYPAQLQPGGYRPDPFRGHTQASADPYGGYANAPYPQRGSPSPGPGLPNPHEIPSPSHSPPATEYIPTSQEHIPASPVAHESEEEFHEAPPGVGRDDDRLSYADDADYGQTSRVLRVANE
ncbi:hypothetical protein BJ138DRAFT_700343 [Hygrophoropsis aurantiaca]|uniref:Uncharacterized protein n=1 Tax=Hygrophoropsis aurantiaca TaxID=72124 RepID=A0ACB7ZYV9_9AGAM|nr:hypothetical protein BJ138DRAFT_700343 [Hygrophoropsis aurantiaca]